MKLRPNKIYKVIAFQSAMCMPTLSVKGDVQIYASVSGKEPTSTSEMFVVDNIEPNSLNTVVGLIRWVCAVYEDNGSNDAQECGLISYPATMTE